MRSSSSMSMLESTSEIVTAGRDEDAGQCSANSEQIDMGNQQLIHMMPHVQPSLHLAATSGASCLQQHRLPESGGSRSLRSCMQAHDSHADDPSNFSASSESEDDSLGALFLNQAASMMRAAILFGASTLRPVQPTAAETNIAVESSRTPLKRGRNMRISKDPQSVAARHRRKRISDRIRVLRRLVPGGTKMDTASMLDEAIQYVKFLKLQLQTLEQLGIQGLCDDLRYDSGAAIGGSQSSTVVPEDLRAVQPFDLNSCTQKRHVQSKSPKIFPSHPKF
ncbi:unnamed protein product [Sphagnum compactum]